MSYSEFLTYATGTGVAVIVGVVLSFLVEYVPGYTLLSAKRARLVFYAACLAVPLIATAMGVLTSDWANVFDPTWYDALVAGVLAASAGTLAHTRKL